MKISYVIFAALTIAIITRVYTVEQFDIVIPSAITILTTASMIFRSRFWAEHILTFGFWESMAKDYNKPQNSAPAIALLGWVALGLYTFFIWYSSQ